MSGPPPPDEQEARTQRHLAALDTLIAQGMDLASRVHQQAMTSTEPGSARAEPETPQSDPPITAETTALFTQISQTVRRAILLSRKLAEPLPLAAPAKPAPDRIAARKRIIREVEDTIHREAASTEADSLQAELHERVESGDLDNDIGRRPVHEIIAEISRDLGIVSASDQARFKRRTPQDLQALNARAVRPTGPENAEPGLTALRACHKPEPRPPKQA